MVTLLLERKASIESTDREGDERHKKHGKNMGKSSRNGGFDMFFNRRRNYHFEFDEAPKFQMIYGTYMDIYIYCK